MSQNVPGIRTSSLHFASCLFTSLVKAVSIIGEIRRWLAKSVWFITSHFLKSDLWLFHFWVSNTRLSKVSGYSNFKTFFPTGIIQIFFLLLNMSLSCAKNICKEFANDHLWVHSQKVALCSRNKSIKPFWMQCWTQNIFSEQTNKTYVYMYVKRLIDAEICCKADQSSHSFHIPIPSPLFDISIITFFGNWNIVLFSVGSKEK